MTFKFKTERVESNDPATWSILVGLDAECFDDSAPPLTDNGGWWWIAYSEGEEAGYASLKPSSLAPNTAYMSRAGVMPAFRGCGLQKKLIKTRLRYAKAQGFTRVVTDTSEDNVASSNSLISCGFKLWKPAVPWGVPHANYWSKFL